MWPSAVAKTMFWAGTSKSAAAACMPSASCARLNAKTASAVRPGSSAVHWSATAYSPAACPARACRPPPRSPGSPRRRSGRGASSGPRSRCRRPGDPQRLGAGLQRDPLVAAEVGVVAHALDEEVGDVGTHVRQAPGELGVVPDDDAGESREREARDVEPARRGDLVAVQPHLRPDAGRPEREVRVVREDRLARRRVLAGHDPRVRAGALAAADEHGDGTEGAVRGLERGLEVVGAVLRTGLRTEVQRDLLRVLQLAGVEDRRVELGRVGGEQLRHARRVLDRP